VAETRHPIDADAAQKAAPLVRLRIPALIRDTKVASSPVDAAASYTTARGRVKAG
jgi:hypothetical protein